MTASTIELVIFDCDGVLVDSEPLSVRILLQTLAGLGVTLDSAQAYEAFLGRSLASTCAILQRDYGVDVDEAALERMRQHLHAAIESELQPIPGIADTLAALDRPVCVASSSQEERIRLSLQVTGLAGFFGDRVFSATMVTHGKPAPDLFLYAARQMHADPQRCMVVEDSPAGVRAALAAGMRVLAFAGGSHAQSAEHRARLAALDPQAVFEDMHALPDLLREQEKSRKVS